MAKLRMAYASTHGARKPPGPKLSLIPNMQMILTARFKMRRFVVFLIFLFRVTTKTTRRLPMKPMMMMTENRMGTKKGTIFINVFKSAFRSLSLASSISNTNGFSLTFAFQISIKSLLLILCSPLLSLLRLSIITDNGFQD